MSAGGISRLRAVGPAEEEPGLADIPVDVLRFAMLPEERRTLLLQVNDLLEEIDYGTVVIVMHEGTRHPDRDVREDPPHPATERRRLASAGDDERAGSHRHLSVRTARSRCRT